MDELFLLFPEGALILVIPVFLIFLFAFNKPLEDGQHEHTQGANQSYFMQKRVIGRPFGRETVVRRWQTWLGTLLPLLFLALVAILWW